MRHLVSVVLAPILGVAVYVLLGIAIAQGSSPADGWDVDNIIALSAAAGAGVCYAALVLPRWSPLGLVPVGLCYLGATAWLYSDSTSFVDIMPDDIFGSEFAGVAPAAPITAALAIPLLATVASARRWRRYPHPVPAPMGPAYPAPPPPPPAEPPIQSGYPAYGGSGATVPLTYSDPISAPPYGEPQPPPQPGYPLMNPDRTQHL
jgi:hypothetical protein